ncbi:hypothetical protein MRX96_042407 [Rhipicephalus microplus]
MRSVFRLLAGSSPQSLPLLISGGCRLRAAQYASQRRPPFMRRCDPFRGRRRPPLIGVVGRAGADASAEIGEHIDCDVGFVDLFCLACHRCVVRDAMYSPVRVGDIRTSSV